VQKDLAEIENFSRFRPPLHRRARKRQSVDREQSLRKRSLPVDFLSSALKWSFTEWSCLQGRWHDEGIATTVILECFLDGVVRMEEERLNCALCIGGNWYADM